MTDKLLDIQKVTKIFDRGMTSQSQVIAVENVSLSLPVSPAKTITLAGESGSGKTTLGHLVLGFLKANQGAILYKGKDLQKLNHEEKLSFRREIQAIFQNPYEAYNPFYKIDHIFDLAIRKFKISHSSSEAKEIIASALEMVRLDAKEILGRYPHQLSGGQLQRIMLARAFLLKPTILVADEPVSMIDASLRVIVLDILADLKNKHGISQIYITHDLSTAYQISDDIMIMYQGNVIENGRVEAVIGNPRHPYTQLLIQSIPLPNPAEKWQSPLQAQLPDEVGIKTGSGCKFFARCPRRMDICKTAFPEMVEIDRGHSTACYLYTK